VVSTPTGTLSITLVPAPTLPISFLDNPANLIPMAAFIGVIVTIIFGWKKMKIELKASADQAKIERDQSRDQASLDRQHDAEQAHQERITKARREVYLELIAEMTKSQIGLGLLPSQEIEKLDVYSSFAGLITATAKISLLGEMETVKRSRELLTAIQETLIRAMVVLIPISGHKDTRRFHESQRVVHQAECARLLPIVNDYARRQFSSKDSADAISNLNHNHAKAEEHGNAAIAAILAFSVANREFHETLMAENIVITKKLDLLVYSMRNELALITSLEELQQSSAAMGEAAKAAIRNMYEDVNARVGAA
jgi:hypothetical protein